MSHAGAARRVLLVDAVFELALGLALTRRRPTLPSPVSRSRQAVAGVVLLPVAAVLAGRAAVGGVRAGELQALAAANGTTAAVLGGWLARRSARFTRSGATVTGAAALALAALATAQARLGWGADPAVVAAE